jgi:hypothetical protein
MASANDKIALKGSEREALPQATVLGATNPQDRIEVTVILHPPLKFFQRGKLSSSKRNPRTAGQPVTVAAPVFKPE